MKNTYIHIWLDGGQPFTHEGELTTVLTEAIDAFKSQCRDSYQYAATLLIRGANASYMNIVSCMDSDSRELYKKEDDSYIGFEFDGFLED